MLSNVVMFPRFLHFFGSEYSPMEAHGVSFRHVLVLCRRAIKKAHKSSTAYTGSNTCVLGATFEVVLTWI
ncbi:hypothetical protein HanIR_Chr07g0338061 [Helianthus annuus]|nr:hypothetical protein HanIR_Chr07g0338061 [Helianthus annuus]